MFAVSAASFLQVSFKAALKLRRDGRRVIELRVVEWGVLMSCMAVVGGAMPPWRNRGLWERFLEFELWLGRAMDT